MAKIDNPAEEAPPRRRNNPSIGSSRRLYLLPYHIIYIAAGNEVHIRKADTIHAKTAKIDGSGKGPAIVPPRGSIASSLVQKNYTKHLIDRYHEFAADQSGRDFNYAAIYATIKKTLGQSGT